MEQDEEKNTQKMIASECAAEARRIIHERLELGRYMQEQYQAKAAEHNVTLIEFLKKSVLFPIWEPSPIKGDTSAKSSEEQLIEGMQSLKDLMKERAEMQTRQYPIWEDIWKVWAHIKPGLEKMALEQEIAQHTKQKVDGG